MLPGSHLVFKWPRITSRESGIYTDYYDLSQLYRFDRFNSVMNL